MPESTEATGPTWYKPTEAAAYLRVSRQTLYRYMEQGLLTYYELKSGGGRRLRRSDLDALLEKQKGKADNQQDSSEEG